MDETSKLLHRTQGMMVYLGSLANGLEELLGRGSDSVCFRAGLKVGLETKVEQKAEGDLQSSLVAVQSEMTGMGIHWPYTPYQRSTDSALVQENERGQVVKLWVRNCIVRCTLFRYGFPQKQSLCQTKHGLFCGLFQQIYGNRCNMGILHAGENACLLGLNIVK